MKQRFTLLLTIFLLVSSILCVPAAAATANGSFDLYFEFDKESYEVGDTIVASLYLDRTDSIASFKLHAISDFVHYPLLNLEYLGVGNTADGMRVSSSAITKQLGRVNIIFTETQTATDRAEKLLVAELKFKALANTRSAALTNDSLAVQAIVAGQNANVSITNGTITIGNPAAAAYTVSFSANGGTGSAPSAISEKSAGDQFVLPNNTYTRTGNSFAGWSDGTATYQPGDVYTMPAKNVTFSPVWSVIPVAHSITFSANGGTGTAPSYSDKLQGNTIALPANTFTYVGYAFQGWSYQGTLYQPGDIFTMPDAAVTLSASWKQVSTEEPLPDGTTEVTETVIDGIVYKNPFTDVKSTDWFYEDVVMAYSQGLVNGAALNSYQPNTYIRLSEAVKLAACLHQLYTTGSVTLTNGGAIWYQSYVDYALENGILTQNYTDYSAYATRTQFGQIFAAALPDAGYAAINAVSDGKIPDVPMGTVGAASIYRLYRAGVLTGSDSIGSFRPNDNIKRSEVAAILTRMYNESARKAFTLS